MRPFAASIFGDLFLQNDSGEVFWLDVGSAALNRIAGSKSEFSWLVRSQENANDWFGASLFERLCEELPSPQTGECFTYWQLPILGGSYEPGNFKIVPLQIHFNIWGPIHEQIKDMPDGTTIDFKVVP